MDPSEVRDCIDPEYREKELSPKELLLRRAFVQEYMRDRNAYAACIRMGFIESYAADWARAFMGEGVVRRLIAKSEEYEQTPEAKAARASTVESLAFKEAQYYGPGASHGARVSALGLLAKIHGLEAANKTEAEVTYKGGVMMVPALTSPDEWGKLASQSQDELKQSVKD